VAYYVIKTIKGHKYIYQQSTYRIGKDVRTVSQYLCPIEHAERAVGYFFPFVDHNRRFKTRIDLVVKIDTSRLHISKETLTKDHHNAVGRLQKKGLRTIHFPSIQILYGSEVGITRDKHGYCVNTTRWKGNSNKFRFAYRKALAFASLDTFYAGRPDLYHRIQLAFDKSYEQTHRLLIDYFRYSKQKNAFYKLLALRMLRVAHAPHHAMHPQTIGLSEFGERKTWRDEFAALYAEVHSRGIRKIYKETNDRYFMACKTEKELMEKRTIFFLARRKELKKVLARKGLLQERMHKLEMMKWFF
jgi:hypothetical protein